MTNPIDDQTIAEAVRRLHKAAPDASIILFGSYARGDQHAESDLDFLVIEPDMQSRHEEMVRLRDVLRSMHIPVDVVVTSTDDFQEWADVPGTLFHEAKQEGKLFHATQS